MLDVGPFTIIWMRRGGVGRSRILIQTRRYVFKVFRLIRSLLGSKMCYVERIALLGGSTKTMNH